MSEVLTSMGSSGLSLKILGGKNLGDEGVTDCLHFGLASRKSEFLYRWSCEAVILPRGWDVNGLSCQTIVLGVIS